MNPSYPHTAEMIPAVSTVLSTADRWDHILARWAINRMGHRVKPGLYRVGNPTDGSPILVTANYTLSFDALRSVLMGIDALILVLDTRGVNVWCAAGEGTFGTEELVRRIEISGLAERTRGRVLTLPQLGAPGVSAHEVKQRTGFRVEYGPVRAADLPEYLRAHRATPEMRRVRFSLKDRLTLIPVELVHVLFPLLVVWAGLYLSAGWIDAAGAAAAILAGAVLFPILLPWLPGHDFSVKGLILGALVALPFALLSALDPSGGSLRVVSAVGLLLGLPPVTGYLALNFTGCTTFTSRTGVRTEIYRYIPVMAVTFAAGVLLAVAGWVLGRAGG